MQKYINLLLILGTIIFTGCLAGFDPNAGTYTIDVPTNIIQKNIDAKLPLKKSLSIGTLKINSSDILTQNSNDKLNLGTTFSFSSLLIPTINGKVNVTGGIKYNTQNKSFYLKDPMLDKLQFNNFVLSRYLTPSMKDLISKIIGQSLAKYPIYRLDGNMELVSKVLRNVKIQNGDLKLTFGL